MAEIVVTGVTPVVLYPGDKVLIAFGQNDMDEAELATVAAMLRERFPDVEITFIAGAERLIVQRGE